MNNYSPKQPINTHNWFTKMFNLYHQLYCLLQYLKHGIPFTNYQYNYLIYWYNHAIPNYMHKMKTNSIAQFCPFNSNRAIYMLKFENLLIPVGNEFEAQIEISFKFICIIHALRILLHLDNHKMRYRQLNTIRSLYTNRVSIKMFLIIRITFWLIQLKIKETKILKDSVKFLNHQIKLILELNNSSYD